jgi:cytochrome c-type biogenesis protein CcmE
MKIKNALIFAAALVLMTVAAVYLSDDIMSPYVSFNETVRSPGKYVQIIGAPEKGGAVEQIPDGIRFTLLSPEGDKLTVNSRGPKPLNFEHAEQAVVLGRYDAVKKEFNADKLLLKCPSKYKKEK